MEMQPLPELRTCQPVHDLELQHPYKKKVWAGALEEGCVSEKTGTAEDSLRQEQFKYWGEKCKIAILASLPCPRCLEKGRMPFVSYSVHYCTERGIRGRRAKYPLKEGTPCYCLQVENPRNKIHHTAPLDHKNNIKSVVCGFANPQGQEIQRKLSTYIFRGLKQSA